MNSRILNMIHVLLSVLFITGVALAFSLKGISDNFLADLIKDRDTTIVFMVLLVGFLSIVLGFIYDRTSVRSREILLEHKDSSNVVAADSTTNSSSIDFESFKKELDEVINSSTGDNLVKSTQALYLICNKLHAGQGILFRVHIEGGVPKLKMFASYAYAKNGSQPDEFEFNDGMVGLAAKEEREIILTDLPAGKIKISSGLGKSAPVALHIVPVKYMDEMKGVLELSFFAPLDKQSQRFLQDNLTKIGALL